MRGGPGAHRHSNSQNLLGGGTAYLKVLAQSLEGIGKDATPCRRFSLHNPRCSDPVGPPFVEQDGIVPFLKEGYNVVATSRNVSQSLTALTKIASESLVLVDGDIGKQETAAKTVEGGGVGHNLPQRAPEAFAKAIVDVGSY